MKTLASACFVLFVACAHAGPSTASPSKAAAPSAPGAIAAAAPAPKEALPFIEDDYPRALAAAKAQGVPLFVDAWAPW